MSLWFRSGPACTAQKVKSQVSSRRAFAIKGLYCVALSLLFAALSANDLSATTLNVDFGEARGTPPSTFGAAANQSGAWNLVTATGASNLVDLSGASIPGASLDLSGVGVFFGFESAAALSADQRALVSDNFFVDNDAGNSWSVTLTGLQNGNYNLYVYSATNGVVSTGAFKVNGAVQTEINSLPSATSPLQLGMDYLIVGILISDGSLLIESGNSTTQYSGLAGLQLVLPTPLPAAFPLFGSGLGVIGLMGWRRRKKIAKLAAA